MDGKDSNTVSVVEGDVEPSASPKNEPDIITNSEVVKNKDGQKVIKKTVAAGGIFQHHSKILIAGFVMLLALWGVAGATSSDPSTYFIWSGVFILVLAGAVLAMTYDIKLSWIMTGITVVVFIWLSWDTYKTYSDSGEEGIANAQALFMVSLLATVIIAKFILTDSEGKGSSFVQLICVFFTVMSFNIIYLIADLSYKSCEVESESRTGEIIAYCVLYLTIYNLIGKHPLIALALSVAAFSYFNIEAQNVTSDGGDGDGDGDGNGGDSGDGTLEKTNLMITVALMLMAVFKVMFPSFSMGSILQSKPMMFVMNYLTVAAIVCFLAANLMFSWGASAAVMTGVLLGVIVLLFIIMLFTTLSG